MSKHPALQRRSFLWWLLVIGFLVFGTPRIYDKVTRMYRASRENKDNVARARHQLEAIGRVLEAYKIEYGNYPRPVDGSKDPIVAAKMLYQAATGDGTDMIDGAEPHASDGNLGKDGKPFFAPWFISKENLSRFVHPDLYLIDPWGKPYHYARGDENAQTQNPTKFDLWSETKFDANGDPIWLANWIE